MLKVDGLKVYGLAPVSFELHKGDCLVVRGPSGSGKSLLLRALADLDEAAGIVRLDGQERSQMSAICWRRKMCYLAAESGWWRERVAEHFNHLETAKKCAARLGLDASLFAAPVARLSSGERQRLALVRALEGHPGVLLLDEPTSALDEHSTALVEREIHRLQREGVVMIIVTHIDAQAERLATHVLTIKDGRTGVRTL